MIYLDNAATNAVSNYVLEEMLPYYRDLYGNPHSNYDLGRKCKVAIEKSRETIAKIIKANPEEIYFTSGGSESDNQAIKVGGKSDKRKRIISSKMEHLAVLESLKYMENGGYDIEYARVKKDGKVDLEDIEKLADENTSLISCMLANNETGVIQPIKEIGYIAHKNGAVCHTDAVQAMCHIDIDVRKMNIDMLSASAHKFGGPKGIGFLYIKEGIEIGPFIQGGGQERNMRAGTSNVAGIVGMAAAARESYMNMKRWNKSVKSLRDYTVERLLNEIPEVTFNGDMDERLCNNINVSFKGINGHTLIEMLDIDGICVSGTSACKADKKEVSYVLKEMGIPEDIAKGTIRMTLSHRNTKKEMDTVVESLKRNVILLRKLV